jgi:hypothetical protein
MAEKKMKNPCWKGYKAYGMKKKNGKEVPNCVPINEIKQNTKLNILNNFMENAKPEFTPRGPSKQRPKSWNRGTKSGSEKRKMREQGKREARDINENEDKGISSRLDKIAPNTTQERMKKFIVSKAQENLKRQRTLMGAATPLNTEDTPGALHPAAMADIARGDTEKVATGFRHLAGKILSSGSRTRKLQDDLAAAKRETAAAIAAHGDTKAELAALRAVSRENISSAENADSLFSHLDKPKSP